MTYQFLTPNTDDDLPVSYPKYRWWLTTFLPQIQMMTYQFLTPNTDDDLPVSYPKYRWWLTSFLPVLQLVSMTFSKDYILATILLWWIAFSFQVYLKHISYNILLQWCVECEFHVYVPIILKGICWILNRLSNKNAVCNKQCSYQQTVSTQLPVTRNNGNVILFTV